MSINPVGKTPVTPAYINEKGDIDVAKAKDELAIFDKMKAFDRNKDGKIDKSEQAAYDAAELIAQYDDDGDGKLNDIEKAAYEGAKAVKDKEEKPEKIDIDLAEKEKELKKLKAMLGFDRNKDGIIDKSEKAAYEAADLVAQYDEDGDGVLNDAEKASYEAAKKVKEESVAADDKTKEAKKHDKEAPAEPVIPLTNGNKPEEPVVDTDKPLDDKVNYTIPPDIFKRFKDTWINLDAFKKPFLLVKENDNTDNSENISYIKKWNGTNWEYTLPEEYTGKKLAELKKQYFDKSVDIAKQLIDDSSASDMKNSVKSIMKNIPNTELNDSETDVENAKKDSKVTTKIENAIENAVKDIKDSIPAEEIKKSMNDTIQAIKDGFSSINVPNANKSISSEDIKNIVKDVVETIKNAFSTDDIKYAVNTQNNSFTENIDDTVKVIKENIPAEDIKNAINDFKANFSSEDIKNAVKIVKENLSWAEIKEALKAVKDGLFGND